MPFGRSKKAYQPLKNLAELASEEYRDLVNVYFRHNPESPNNQDTEVIKTKGFIQYGTNTSTPPANRGLGIGSFTPSVGTYGGFYAAWDRTADDYTEIWRLSSSGDATSVGVYAFLPTQDTDIEFEQANDNQYVTNGIDPVLLQTGSTGAWTQAAASTAPYGPAGTVAKFLSWYNYMMFAARTVAAPNILYVSNPGDPTTFTGPVTKTFRHEIVGLRPLADYLMVYTKKEIHAVTGFVPSSLSYRQLINAHPCVSHRSIVQVTGDNGAAEHWYLGADYVWATNGSSFRELGKESWERFKENINTTQLQLAAAVFDDETGQYLLSVPTGSSTKNTVTWAYDPMADKWIEKPFYYGCAWAKHGSPTPTIVFQDSNSTGKVYEANNGNGVQSQKTLLNGSLAATATYAVVDSTTGFPDAGVIMVENEAIYYGDTTATKFGDNATGVALIRGYQGTTAATHADNTPVYPAMQFRYRTRNLDIGETNLIKKFQILWVNVLPSTIDYSLSVNVNVDRQGYSVSKHIPLATNGMTWGTDVWGSTTWGAPEIILTPDNRAPLAGRGKTMKISLDESASIQQTEIVEMELALRPVKKK